MEINGYRFGIVSGVFLITTIVSLFIAYLIWSRRGRPGAWQLFWLELAAAQWALSACFEAAATTVPLDILWSQISYVGIVTSPVCFFLFALAYGRQTAWLSPFRIGILFVVPAFCFVVAATNNIHWLHWSSVTIPPGTTLAIYGHGPLFWILVVYEYLMLTAGVFLLLWSALRVAPFYHRPITCLVLGSILPFVANLLYVFEIGPFPGLDWTPVAFSLTGALLAVAICWYRIFDLVPIVQNKVFESMTDGVLVLDFYDFIVDLNPAAARLLETPPERLIGKSTEDALATWPTLLQAIREVSDTSAITIARSADLFIEAHTALIRTPRIHMAGKLVMMRDISEQKKFEARLKELASTDGLTGLYNRRHFFQQARQEVDRARRFGHQMTVLMLDADKFKNVNDTYGHDIGDRVLEKISELIRASLRSMDFSGRLGGEEFAVLLPETALSGGLFVAERIRQAMAETTLETDNGPVRFTVSIGVAELDPDGGNLETMLKAADEALYRAKTGGRNRVES